MESLPLGRTGILGIAILFGILQGLFLGAVFWTRTSGDRLSNRLLGTLILIITVHLAEIFLLLSGLISRAPFLSGTTFPLIFLIAPAFYLYARRLLVPGYRLRWLHLLHALPAAYVLWDSLPWILAAPEVKEPYHLLYQTLEVPAPSGAFLVVLAFNVVQHVVYLALTLRLIRRRQAEAVEHSADGSLVDGLRTFRRVTTGFAVYAAFYLAFFLALMFWGRYGVVIDTLWLVLLAMFIQTVGYAAMARPATFAHSLWTVAREAEAPLAADYDADPAPEASALPLEPVTPAGSKYRRSSLSEERARRIHRDLVEYMKAERPYLDGKLTLRAVAARLSVSPHHLSQVINQEAGQNFFDFVNRYRVEEAKGLLARAESRNLTVLAIGYEAGFNNKASFNTAFRKFTDMTPSAYRDRQA